jgi:hypothetical protein
MHFGTKSYLKSNRYHIAKHPLYEVWSCIELYLSTRPKYLGVEH